MLQGISHRYAQRSKEKYCDNDSINREPHEKNRESKKSNKNSRVKKINN